jgi:AraC family transcriptional regulator
MYTSTVVSDAKSRAQLEGLSVPDPGSCNGNAMLAGLLASATVAMDTDRRAAKTCIQRAAALLGIELIPGGEGVANRTYRGGLALWQSNRLKSYIEDKLDSSIRITDLAAVVQLSAGHFCRSFRKTFGETPMAYIMRRRVQRAQELMLASRLPLSQVALECGMSDQAHLCRVFRRFVGINPSAWRRQFPVAAPAGLSRGLRRAPVEVDDQASGGARSEWFDE